MHFLGFLGFNGERLDGLEEVKLRQAVQLRKSKTSERTWQQLVKTHHGQQTGRLSDGRAGQKRWKEKTPHAPLDQYRVRTAHI